MRSPTITSALPNRATRRPLYQDEAALSRAKPIVTTPATRAECPSPVCRYSAISRKIDGIAAK